MWVMSCNPIQPKIYNGSNGLLSTYINPEAVMTGGGKQNSTESEFVLINGVRNSIGRQSTNVTVTGNDNLVGGNCENVFIMNGNNNTIPAGVKNSFIIANDFISIQSSNEGWIGDIHIVNGEQMKYFKYVDGGLNCVVPIVRSENFTVFGVVYLWCG